jgi:SNF2 family DNA or RNA helicase
VELFPYQQEAVDKFKRIQHVLLGDDMGLGKTVIAIALDKERRTCQLNPEHQNWFGNTKKRTLVVCPKSMIGSWADHYATWAPGSKVLATDTKDRTSFVRAAVQGTHNVYICHWEMLRLEPQLQQIKWLHLIADEVHRAKNRKAQVTQALKKVKAIFKTGLSGTWADNKPDDAWSVLNWLYPRKWTSYHRFVNHHIIQRKHDTTGSCQAGMNSERGPCGKYHRTAFNEIVGVHDAETIQRDMAPFYLRRRKQDVLKDLPEKYYTSIRVDLHPKQRRAYDAMRRDMLAWIGKHENEPVAAPVVISQLVRLQQFAVAFGRLETRRVRRHDKELDKWFVEERDVLLLDEPSSKLDAVMELLDDTDEPVVVFSKSKQVIYLLAERLKRAGVTYRTLTGDTKQADREQYVRDFQAGKFQVFAGTIRAGGEGITLTRASRMIFLDREWSPSKNKQAEDRIWRYGQKNACQIIDIMAKETVDFGARQKLITKWSWIRQILGDKGAEVAFGQEFKDEQDDPYHRHAGV